LTGGWKIQHNEEIHNLYCSSYIIRMIKWTMEWVGHVAHMGEMRSAYILVRKREGNTPFGKPRRRWEDNIKMEFR
jgi:hypothetical protein